jgi:hypothetical protein
MSENYLEVATIAAIPTNTAAEIVIILICFFS